MLSRVVIRRLPRLFTWSPVTPHIFSLVDYNKLNARQKENYNFQKISAVLADYGFVTMRLSDDWLGADFIALHTDGETFLKVQLKGRLYFEDKYRGKGLYIAFPCGLRWYLYPHDEVLGWVLANGHLAGTTSWDDDGKYHFPKLPEWLQEHLKQYMLAGRAEIPPHMLVE